MVNHSRTDPAATRAWCARYVWPGEPVPAFGSTPWAALPDAHPFKVAGCVRAALVAFEETEPAAVRRRLGERIIDVQEYLADGGELAAEVRKWAARPSHEELQRRRQPSERSGDYPGRAGGVVGVDWASGRWLRSVEAEAS